MFDGIPLENYTPIYYYILLVIVLIVILDSQSYKTPSGNKFQFFGIIFLLFTVIYIGFRPISGRYFGDMGAYSRMFNNYSRGQIITSTKDLLFQSFMKASSSIMDVQFFFFVCALLYVLPIYIVCKKWFRTLWFYGFIFFVSAFSFWAYGTNGIRNGIAGSLFLLGMSRDKRLSQIILIIVSVSIHKTMLLPAAGFLLANFYNQPKKLIYFWLLCIPLSLLGGGFFESFFGTLGFDERLSYLIAGNVNEDEFSSTGFRWDFLAYSGTAIFAGWYYIIKKGYKDKVYFWLFNTYVFANAFWILVIRANFSNRFAYLSWFMIGLVIIYPLLKETFIPGQYKKVGFILLLYFSFTFFMNFILN